MQLGIFSVNYTSLTEDELVFRLYDSGALCQAGVQSIYFLSAVLSTPMPSSDKIRSLTLAKIA